MPRIATSLPGLALSLLLLPLGSAEAAGFGRGVAPGPAPAMSRFLPRPAGPALRSAPRGQHIVSGRRAPRFHHRGANWFLGGPGYYPFDSGSETVILRDRDNAEPEREVDLDSFENMPVRMGIERSPEPRPVIYRIEGTRARPSVRVLRVGIDDRRAGYRHLASREGGNAEILTFRRR